MWDTLENVFYIIVLLLFATTFMPRSVRRQVRSVLVDLWRFLCQLWRAIEPHAYRIVTGRPMPEDAPEQPPARFKAREPNPSVRDDFPLPDAENDEEEQQSSVREPAFALALTEDEIAAVARMIAHNKLVEKPTQSSAIEAGFGYKRGGGPGYDRAREIYQALFTQPKVTAFPELTTDKQRAQPKKARA